MTDGTGQFTALSAKPLLNAEPRAVGTAAALFLSHAFEQAISSHTTARVYPDPLMTTTAGDETELVTVCNELMRRQSPQDRGAYFARGAVIFAGLAQEAFVNAFEERCISDGLGTPSMRKHLAARSVRQRFVDIPQAYVGRQVIQGALLEDACKLAQLRNRLVHPTTQNGGSGGDRR